MNEGYSVGWLQPHRYTGSFSSQTLTKNRQKMISKKPVFQWFIFRRSCIRSMPAQLREQRQTLWWWRFTTFTLWLCLSLWTRHTVNLRNESQRNWTSRHLICASGNSRSWQTNALHQSKNVTVCTDIWHLHQTWTGRRFSFSVFSCSSASFSSIFLLIHHFLSLPRPLSLDVSTTAPACWHLWTGKSSRLILCNSWLRPAELPCGARFVSKLNMVVEVSQQHCHQLLHTL